MTEQHKLLNTQSRFSKAYTCSVIVAKNFIYENTVMFIEDIFQYIYIYIGDYYFTIVVIPPLKKNNNTVLLSKYFVIKCDITMSNNVNTSTAQHHTNTKHVIAHFT